MGSVETSTSTWAEEADEANKLKYSASDIEKFTVEKVAVVANGEAAKDFKIFIFTSSEEADDATKLLKLAIIPLIWKSSSVINATKHNFTTYVGGALT